MFFWKSEIYFPFDETLLFTLRNHIFHRAKPYLLQGETISFTRRNHIFYKAKPYLLQGETLSFTRQNHIFCKVKPYLLQTFKSSATCVLWILLFVSLGNIFFIYTPGNYYQIGHFIICVKYDIFIIIIYLKVDKLLLFSWILFIFVS